ncbi:MAG: AI-2E family transporter [Reyranellaceae bacterium]
MNDLGSGSLGRTAALAVIGAIVIVGLHFGQDVLIPAAVAVLLAFILGPLVSRLRRVLPAALAVTLVVIGAAVVVGLLGVLVTVQLADVADSLTTYQDNLHRKIEDVRALTREGGSASRFMTMVASLARDMGVAPGPAEAPVVRVQGASSFASVLAFVAPLAHPLVTVGIAVILVVFILLDRDHLSDQFVRLFGASDVHATSEALNDAARRVARALSLQLLTNAGYAVVVGGGLFALGLPNAALWALLAGALRFIPFVGGVLGSALPTVIAVAVLPGWLDPLLVLGWIVVCDLVLGQIIEPLLFGDSTGVTPLALIMSAIFWGSLWGPVGLLLATPLTICLLVLGRHVPHLGFLQVVLSDEPALAPYQQIYRRLIARAVPDAGAVALAEIEAEGPQAGLDAGLGRMIVLAETDRAQGRLDAAQVEAIVAGTAEVLEFLEAAAEDHDSAPAAPDGHEHLAFACVGGRGEIDDAAAAVIAYALRRAGFQAESRRRADKVAPPVAEEAVPIDLICYAAHPSDAVRRYNLRRLKCGLGRARHVVLDYDVAPVPSLAVPGVAGPRDVLAGDIAAICRLAAQHAAALAA